MRAADPRRLKFDRLEVTPRTAERVILRNGIVAHLLPDPDLPVIRFGALVRTGSVFDPADKAGLASLTGTAMRLGGGGDTIGDALDEELDFMGADLDSAVDEDSFSFRAWCMKRHFPRMISIFSNVLRRPAFPEDKIELAKSQALEMIRRRWDQPATTATLMFRRQVYGAESAWGRLSSEASLKGLSLTDMAGMHDRSFTPGSVNFVAAGDFDLAEMSALLDNAFGDWAPGARAAPEGPAPVVVSFPGGVFLVPRAVGQANFRIGHLGVKTGHPDLFPLKLMDMILGNGSFNTRLFRDIRTERGLAYAIWSRLAPRPSEVGTFQVGGETKYETLDETIGAILAQLKKLRNTDVTAEEMRLAKESLDNSFAFEFQSPWNTAWRQATNEHYHLPADWIFREREGILVATRRDVRRVARAHVHPEGMTILVAGDPDKCADKLRRFGTVTELLVPE